ncbi:hypothetical protein GCM10018966_102550 [Streptomyces yanii]
MVTALHLHFPVSGQPSAPPSALPGGATTRAACRGRAEDPGETPDVVIRAPYPAGTGSSLGMDLTETLGYSPLRHTLRALSGETPLGRLLFLPHTSEQQKGPLP